MRNINKTKCMSCMPGHISNWMSTTAYKCHMEGTGLSHWESQRHRVECSECGVELAASSLQHHRCTIHGLLTDMVVDNVNHPGCQAQLYHVSFPRSFLGRHRGWMSRDSNKSLQSPSPFCAQAPHRYTHNFGRRLGPSPKMQALWDACYLPVTQNEPLQFDNLSGGSSL